MPGTGAAAIIAVCCVAVIYLFAFTLIGFAAEVLALVALLVLAGRLGTRLLHCSSD
jgi:hypothetical protein